VSKSISSIVPLKKTIIFIGIEVGKGASPSTSLKPCATPDKILVLEVTLGLVGHDFSATTESTCIFPPSLLLISMSIEFGCRFGVGLYFAKIERRHHQMWHHLLVGFQTQLVQLLVFPKGLKCLPNNFTNLFLIQLPLSA